MTPPSVFPRQTVPHQNIHVNPNMSSTDKVFNTPELFELILLELPLRTLLTRASLVSKQWRNFITSSPALQRALFFKTCPSGTPSRVNPLMAADFPIFFDGKGHNMDSFHQLPFARITNTKSRHSRVADDADVLEAPSVSPKHLALRAAFLHPSASWRRMMPRQPAVDEPVFWHYVTNRHYRCIGNLSVSCRGNMYFSGYDDVVFDEEPAGGGFGPEGWTMGALYDVAINVAHSGRRSFRVFWDAQAYMRREAEEAAEMDDPDQVHHMGPDEGIAKAKVHVHDRDGKMSEEETPNENVLGEDVSDEEEMLDVMSLVDALGGREVVFQTMVQKGCRGMGRGINNYNTPRCRSFMRYYSFPAVNLDAE